MTSVEWHTAGRRQPEIFGKDMAGRRLVGGPYTSVQAGLMAVAAVVSWVVAVICRQPTSVVAGLVVGATMVGYFVGRRLDLSNGNPYFAVSGFCRVMSAAASPRQLVWARGSGGLIARRPAPAVSVTPYSPMVMDTCDEVDAHVEVDQPHVEVLTGEESPLESPPPSPPAALSPLAAFLAAAGQNS